MHRFGCIDRNRKPNAEDWSAPLLAIIVVMPITSPRAFSNDHRVPRVHRSIRLDRVLNRIAFRPSIDGSRRRSARQRSRQAKRIADGKYNRCPDDQPCESESVAGISPAHVDLDQREVVPLVDRQYRRFVLVLVESVTSTRCALSMTWLLAGSAHPY